VVVIQDTLSQTIPREKYSGFHSDEINSETGNARTKRL